MKVHTVTSLIRDSHVALNRKRVRPAEINFILARATELGVIHFLYLSKSGDGVSRYVFRDQVCIGARKACTYALAALESKPTL